MTGDVAPIFFTEGESPLGPVLAATTLKGICYIALDNDRSQMVNTLESKYQGAPLIEGGKQIQSLMDQIVDFISSPRIGFDPKLDTLGTPFQLRVWDALKSIGVGSTASYTQIASMIGSPRAIRAVAGACAANSIAIAIPCHRIVGKNGEISGYRWGISRKKELLAREQAGLSESFQNSHLRSKVP